MKTLKNILRKIDLFGVPFAVRYKKQNKYSTSLGGFFFILYYIAGLFIIIYYYFIPFIKRKNFSTIYYSMNLPNTEKVILKE